MDTKTLTVITVVVLCILIIWYYKFYKFGTSNTVQENILSNTYNVHREHYNPREAAKLLNEITNRNDILLEHLKEKYDDTSLSPIDPLKNNHIDVINSSEMYSQTMGSINNVQTREYLQERVEQLIQNYRSDKIYEISPLNPQGNTSYAEGKKVLVLCLRQKIPDMNGNYPLHDVNTMMFVVLHELAHMMNDLWGHGEESNFWYLFKFLLVNALEIDIYKPVNYGLHPIVYCGLKLTYNPLYDTRINV